MGRDWAQTAVAVGTGALGAVGLDVAMAYLPLPTMLQTGWANILTRAAGAVGLGWLAGMAMGKKIGSEVAAGGLIVVAYSGIKQVLAPTLGTSVKGLSGLADFGDYAPAYGQQSAAMVGGMGAYMAPRMGAYMQPRLGAYMNPAPFIGAAAPAASPLAARQRMAGFGNFGGGSFSDDM